VCALAVLLKRKRFNSRQILIKSTQLGHFRSFFVIRLQYVKNDIHGGKVLLSSCSWDKIFFIYNNLTLYIFDSLPHMEYANWHRQYLLSLTSANIGDSQRVPQRCISYVVFVLFNFWGETGCRFLLALPSSIGNPIDWHCGLLYLQYSFWEVAVLCRLLDVQDSTRWCERVVRWLRSGWPMAENIIVGLQHKVRIQLEYLSVSVPSSKLWPPGPYPQANVSPLEPKGGTHSPAGEGGGVPSTGRGSPPPLRYRVAKTGRNNLKEGFTPLLPTGIGERF
jgi:hypothetical protein